MGVSIVILAAGLGTRMKSSKAKVLQKLCGQSMILHILKKAFSLSDDVSVVLSYQKESVEKEILEHFPSTQILEQDLANFPGTAGALKHFKPKHERLLILCGDMPLVETSSLKSLLENEAEFSVAAFKARDAKSYGRVVLDDLEVQKIVEVKDANEKELAIDICNAGVYALNSKLLLEILPLIDNANNAKEYYLTDAIKLAKDKGASVKACFVDEDEFMGVNDKFELSVAENLMQENIKKKWAKEGVIFHNPASIFIGLEVEFEGECEVYENVRIEGKSKIVNSIIKSSSVIEESVVENSDVGPLAHLRPKTRLYDTHIGNFVECKNAVLKGVKAGHLSYLGDCEIDEGTNIGCGTITCNYDGVKKYKSIIGKNVFIGSNTNLIAPVSIQDEVLIAAGSSVSGEIKQGSLFIERGTSRVLDEYYYKKFGKK